jgi:hypothetical protein
VNAGHLAGVFRDEMKEVSMALKPDDSVDDAGRDARISEMTEKLQQIADGKMVACVSNDLPAAQREQFWREVLAFENGPFTTDFARLVQLGLELPDAASMDDATLSAKLSEVIRGLARLRVFISQTDHLSDRQLYVRLWTEALRHEIPAIDCGPDSAWHVDLLSTGRDEDTHLYLKFYADERARRLWREEFPDYVIPAHEEPPYDRDRHLPQPY